MNAAKHLSIILAVLSLGVQPVQATPQMMGPGSCSSSNCHGNVKPLNSSDILQNEYITWSKHDRHSRAFLTLQNADSKKIASNLGIGDPAKETLCLKCHSTYVQDGAPKSDTFRLEDGVSCEACHGAAEGYLKSHAVTGTTHADNIANGLTDLSNINTRATLCLSCHFGTDDKTVNHNLYGAGHPRLTFEIDTFGVLQPKHWVVDADYERRKGPYIPMRAWLMGQLHHAQAALAALESPTRSKNGSLPELSLFDCFSCHHSLTEKQWKKRSYGGQPGQLKLNLPALVILQVAASSLDPSLGDEIASQLRSLHDGFRKGNIQESVDSLQNLIVNKVGPSLEQVTVNPSTSTRMLSGLSGFAANNPWPTFELAEQLGMGMQATIASSADLATRYDKDLKDIFSTLKSAEAFKPDAFTAAAQKLSRKMTKTK
jgi:Cytochrome c554 and c-prime